MEEHLYLSSDLLVSNVDLVCPYPVMLESAEPLNEQSGSSGGGLQTAWSNSESLECRIVSTLGLERYSILKSEQP